MFDQAALVARLQQFEISRDKLSCSPSEGLYARFHANGRLAHLGDYVGAACEGWYLDIDEAGETGRARLDKGSGGSADTERWTAGRAERFDAWSDNSPSQRIELDAWVREWVDHILRHHARPRPKRKRKRA